MGLLGCQAARLCNSVALLLSVQAIYFAALFEIEITFSEIQKGFFCPCNKFIHPCTHAYTQPPSFSSWLISSCLRNSELNVGNVYVCSYLMFTCSCCYHLFISHSFFKKVSCMLFMLVTCLSVHCLQLAALSHRMFRLMLRTTPPSWWPGSVPVQCMTQPSTGTLSHTRSCRAKTSASRSTGPTETRMWYARSFYISPQNAEKQRLDV